MYFYIVVVYISAKSKYIIRLAQTSAYLSVNFLCTFYTESHDSEYIIVLHSQLYIILSGSKKTLDPVLIS